MEHVWFAVIAWTFQPICTLYFYSKPSTKSFLILYCSNSFQFQETYHDLSTNAFLYALVRIVLLIPSIWQWAVNLSRIFKDITFLLKNNTAFSYLCLVLMIFLSFSFKKNEEPFLYERPKVQIFIAKNCKQYPICRQNASYFLLIRALALPNYFCKLMN